MEWRDLPPAAWNAEVRTAQGRTVPASETAWMRAREVWVHAVDLDNGASFADFPPDFLDALLSDIAAMWRRRGEGMDLELAPTDRSTGVGVGERPTVRIGGAAADVAQWATGRGGDRVTASTGSVPTPPRWL